MSFEKILVANRGEIACRIIQSARSLGYRTVAVYSDADREARAAALADEAVFIGPATAAQSYLSIEAMINACHKTGADAVHPGYGFLSENTDFAAACADAGITFIGPPPEAIRLMGSKRHSKIAMQEAQVPCIPGYDGEKQDDDTLIAEAQRIGLPLMIKASAGGGGRGMRVVTDPDQIPEQLRSARSESKNAFGSDELILERAVLQPRHVEIQVFADHHGNVIHLGERDCSIQRRHQKVVEEAPCPVMTAELREQMGTAAVNAARACDYVGAGTVEFLLDPDHNFFFLEMNTRLQVEHPVTESITGQDLVAWQIRVARGEALPLAQDQVRFDGHAMEVRLYAEDPSRDFMPLTGPILRWAPARGDGVRLDHGLRAGDAITSHYDPMLAKVIASGPTREDARRRLMRAVEDTVLMGLEDNRYFLASILRHPVFAKGEATTAFLEDDFAPDDATAPEPPAQALALAAALLGEPRGHRRGWSNAGRQTRPALLAYGDQTRTVFLHSGPSGLEADVGDTSVRLSLEALTGERVTADLDGVRRELAWHRDGNELWLAWPGRMLRLEDQTHLPPRAAEGAGSGRIRAPMDGAVLDVRCAPGDSVQKGDVLVLMEAMKIEHSLTADRDGRVADVSVKTGDQVKAKQLLAELTADEEAAG
jgi:geranyl-CoA carboxylase alpha subunit